jgi:hypothetical protein
MKRAYERLLVMPSCSGRPQCIGDASTMGWSPRTAAAVEWVNLSLECYRGQSWRRCQPFVRSPEDHVWIPDSETRICNIEVALRPRDVWDARAVGYLLRKVAKRGVELVQEEEVCCSQQRWKRSWRSEDCFDISHGDAEFGVCPAGFLSCFEDYS